LFILPFIFKIKKPFFFFLFPQNFLFIQDKNNFYWFFFVSFYYFLSHLLSLPWKKRKRKREEKENIASLWKKGCSLCGRCQMEQKITGLSPETHIHLSCRYHQFITTPLLHHWEAVQHHPSIQEGVPFCIPAHSLAQDPPVPILYQGEKPSALPTHDEFAHVAWRMPSPNSTHSPCWEPRGSLGMWPCADRVCMADIPTARKGNNTTATFGQDMHALWNSFSLPPFDLLNMAGGTGFASLSPTNQPMNVSHICSQKCPDLNASAFNVPLFYLPHSITRRNIVQHSRHCHDVGKKQSPADAAGSKQLIQQMHEQEMQYHVQFLIPYSWLLQLWNTCCPATRIA